MAAYPLTIAQEMQVRALMSQYRYSREQAIIETIGPISVADAKRFARVMSERERQQRADTGTPGAVRWQQEYAGGYFIEKASPRVADYWARINRWLK